MAHPTAPARTALAPRWAVRATIAGPSGSFRDVTLVSDAEDLRDATRSALDVLELADGELVTSLGAFEPYTIAPRGAFGSVAALGGLLGGLVVHGPDCTCDDEDQPEQGDAADVPVNEA